MHDPRSETSTARPPTYCVVRQLTDEDFEDSCVYYFYYLFNPHKYIQKPFLSCHKPHVEISHLIRHVISNHGLIRGRHSTRKVQRYLTQCASDNIDIQGKSTCTHCKDVELWTGEDLANDAHAGKAVCIRCYRQLLTKADLFKHLHEDTICQYNEDWNWRTKSRILYSVFCAPDQVPKFQSPTRPIVSTRRRNVRGARLRNMVSTHPVQASSSDEPASSLTAISEGLGENESGS